MSDGSRAICVAVGGLAGLMLAMAVQLALVPSGHVHPAIIMPASLLSATIFGGLFGLGMSR